MDRDNFIKICNQYQEKIVYGLAHLPERCWFPSDIYDVSPLFEITKKFYDKKEFRLHLAKDIERVTQEVLFKIDYFESVVTIDEGNKYIVLDIDLLRKVFSGKSLEKIIIKKQKYFDYLLKKLNNYIYDINKYSKMDILIGILPLILWYTQGVKYFKFNSFGNGIGYYLALKAL